MNSSGPSLIHCAKGGRRSRSQEVVCTVGSSLSITTQEESFKRRTAMTIKHSLIQVPEESQQKNRGTQETWRLAATPSETRIVRRLAGRGMSNCSRSRKEKGRGAWVFAIEARDSLLEVTQARRGERTC